MTGGETPLKYQEDRQHLEGLLPDFAAEVDLVLLVKDQQRTIGLPVHASWISAHSPVLGQLLNESPATGFAIHQQIHNTAMSQLEYHFWYPAKLCTTGKQDTEHISCLPMTDDSYAAWMAVLKCIYGSCPRIKDLPQSNSTHSYSAPKVSLEEAPIRAEQMLLSHKYGMTKVLGFQAEALMKPLRDAICAEKYPKPNCQQYSTQVLSCAAIADKCECYAMLALCETFITRYYSGFDAQRDLMVETLSKQSMLRLISELHGNRDVDAYTAKHIAKRFAAQTQTPAERLGV